MKTDQFHCRVLNLPTVVYKKGKICTQTEDNYTPNSERTKAHTRVWVAGVSGSVEEHISTNN